MWYFTTFGELFGSLLLVIIARNDLRGPSGQAEDGSSRAKEANQVGRKVSLKDVAEAADVSVITASRAMRGIGRVNPATRGRILKVAESLGYRRYAGQVFTSFGRTSPSEHSLRLVLPLFRYNDEQPNTLFGKRILKGAEEILASTGGSLVPIEADDLNDFISNIPKARIHGIILRQVLPTSWLKEIQGIAPVVYAISHHVQPGVDCILFNEFESTASIYDHLLQRGHRDVVWVYGDRAHSHASVGEERYDGFSGYDRLAHNFTYARIASWRVVDLGMRDRTVRHQYIEIPMMPEAERGAFDPVRVARQVAKRILALPDKPSAAVIYSEDVAYHLEEELRKYGLAVPDDLSLVTYFNSDQIQDREPWISGVDLPFGKLGGLIPELIQRRLTQPDVPHISVALETSFVDLGSVRDLS